MSSLPLTDASRGVGPARSFTFEESGSLEADFQKLQQVLARVRCDLQEIREQLTEYGPSWYDEERDERLAASLQLIEQVLPASDVGSHRTLSRTS